MKRDFLAKQAQITAQWISDTPLDDILTNVRKSEVSPTQFSMMSSERLNTQTVDTKQHRRLVTTTGFHQEQRQKKNKNFLKVQIKEIKPEFTTS